MVIINPVPLPPFGGHAYTNITPFTYRDGWTFQRVLEELRKYIRETLVPLIDGSFESVETYVNNAVSELVTYVDTSIEETETWTTEQIANLTNYVNEQVQLIINDSIEVQDPVVAGIMGDSESNTRNVTDGLYANKDIQTEVETGRLSETSIDATIKEYRGTVVDAEHTTLQAAYEATPVNGILEIRNAHSFDTPFVIDKQINIVFTTGKLISLDRDIDLIRVEADNVTINNVQLEGEFSNVVGIGVGLRAVNCVNITVNGGHIDGFSWAGVRFDHVKDSVTRNILITNVAYSGHMVLSCDNILIENCEVDTVNQPDGFANGYGFAASRWSANSMSTDPNSSNITYLGCIVRNHVKWEAFDTHGGINISWINCSAYNVWQGFAVVGNTTIVGETPTAAKNFFISNCYAESGVDNGSRSGGLVVTGVNSEIGVATDYATGIVDGLVLKNFGTTENTNYGATYIHTTQGLSLSNITIIEPYFAGLLFFHTNDEFNASNIVVIDPWRAASTTKPIGIGFRSTHNKGSITNALVINTGKYNDSAVNDEVESIIRAFSATECRITISQVKSSGTINTPFVNPGGNTIGYEMNGNIPFIGAKRNLTGVRGGNTALTNLIGIFVSMGLITDSTTA